MSEQTPSQGKSKNRLVLLVLILVGAFAATVVITALLMNIFEKKQEGAKTFTEVVALDETTVDPAIWGKNFPIQYEAYKRTAEYTPSQHSGEMVPHDVAGDPRTEVKSSKIEEDPRLVTMWTGYAFATDYRHARGHEYMTLDQEFTRRNTEFKQPGTCANCHASMPAVYKELGNGDVDAGFEKMGTMPLGDLLDMTEHPVACIDCHDPATMELRITRPAFERGIADLKASEGIENYDVNRDATRQEMRSYVCAQCHVEYYFAGEDKVLTFPWANGLDLDDIWDYYQEVGHVDWEHGTTGAKVLKAQHPEFDVWAQGVHAANGVSCADCHMSYERVGAAKVTNHHITSPMADLNASCGTCHTDTDVLEERVTTIQDRFIESRDRAMDALVSLIHDIEAAQKNGTPEANIKLAQEYQNKASFYVDYVYSENSYGFHAPDYEQRILSQSLDAARKGQLALRGATAEELAASDITTNNLTASLRSGGGQSGH
ncbi:ammonia-forming cytochrome c nitrite reductase subunit c552 [Actinomyces sp. F1_1611]